MSNSLSHFTTNVDSERRADASALDASNAASIVDSDRRPKPIAYFTAFIQSNVMPFGSAIVKSFPKPILEPQLQSHFHPYYRTDTSSYRCAIFGAFNRTIHRTFDRTVNRTFNRADFKTYSRSHTYPIGRAVFRTHPTAVPVAISGSNDTPEFLSEHSTDHQTDCLAISQTISTPDFLSLVCSDAAAFS